jgi:protein-S-isoprenylcysteine O-methyltransferase Ste14
MASKKDKKNAAPAPADDLRPRLSQHPRAQRQIREAKAWAGIIGFVLVGLLSLQSGQPVFDAGIRALIAGVGCYVAGWALAVTIWRHLARAEVDLARQRITAEQAAQ